MLFIRRTLPSKRQRRPKYDWVQKAHDNSHQRRFKVARPKARISTTGKLHAFSSYTSPLCLPKITSFFIPKAQLYAHINGLMGESRLGLCQLNDKLSHSMPVAISDVCLRKHGAARPSGICKLRHQVSFGWISPKPTNTATCLGYDDLPWRTAFDPCRNDENVQATAASPRSRCPRTEVPPERDPTTLNSRATGPPCPYSGNGNVSICGSFRGPIRDGTKTVLSSSQSHSSSHVSPLLSM